MRYEFVVTLKRENTHKTDLVSFILLIFSILFFCILQIRSGFNYFQTVAALILLAGLWVNLRVLKKKKEMQFRNWLFTAGLFWLGMPFFQWLFIPFVFFALLEAQAKYPLEIGFHEGGILLNTFFKKKYSWDLLQSVILKDGLLTLDFKDNTLIQKEVLDDDEPDASEDEFNAYCRSKLVNLH